MDRADIMAAMGELKLYGMRAAYDELMAVAVRRQHEPRQIVGDLLAAEINEIEPACRQLLFHLISKLYEQTSVR